MLDLLIQGGLIVDGSGNPGIYAAVGVEGDTVRILRGDVSTVEATRVIDATGRVVCPGFVDIHTHSGIMLLAEPTHMPKVHQGVTTELVGVDGLSYAPFDDQEDLRRLLRFNAGIDGNPPLTATWSTVSEYLDMFDRKVAVNVAYIVGNTSLRIGAVGWDNVRASREQIETMKSMLRQSMDEGAFGLSTGLDYPPGSYADHDEVVELAAEAGRQGGIYHTHARYTLGDKYLDPYRDAIEIARKAGCPLHITHMFRRKTHTGGSKRMLDLVDEAHDSGMDISFDSFPYAGGGSRILVYFPQWAQEGGPEGVIETLSSPEQRDRLHREWDPRGGNWDELWLTYFKTDANRRYEGWSVAQVAEERGVRPLDAICDLLLEEDLQVSYHGTFIDPAAIADFQVHPLNMVASDAMLVGDHPSTMAYGTYPRVLGDMVREERRMSLPEAIRKMTSYPAQRLGLSDRGLLVDGSRADIVVFNPDTVGANTTDAEPRQLSTGIEYVVVNGEVVIDQREHTGALPGRALRHRG
jgi:N-acyl-D-amino-acid deacylase